MPAPSDEQRNRDVAIYYQHLEQLKGFVRRKLQGKARAKVAVSDIVQSALFSLVQDVEAADVPLLELDDEGQPVLLPLLFRYLDRHSDKWNKHFQTRKRGAAEFALGPAGDSAALEPAQPDHQELTDRQLLDFFEHLSRSLGPDEQQVFACWVDQQTLSETSGNTGFSETKVCALRKAIRERMVAGD